MEQNVLKIKQIFAKVNFCKPILFSKKIIVVKL